jgi:hypothetical protein
MVHEFDDPPEFIGATQETKAEPKGKRAAPPVKAAAKLPALAPDVVGHEMAAPVPSVAIYAPPTKGEAHPKIARLAPAQRLNAAEAGLNLANAELQAATHHLRNCELIEAEAEAALVKEMPGPTQDQVHRELLAKETAAKLDRVSQGLPAVEPPKPSHGRSAVDIAAANRPRTNAQQPTGAPLRSNVVRRTV